MNGARGMSVDVKQTNQEMLPVDLFAQMYALSCLICVIGSCWSVAKDSQRLVSVFSASPSNSFPTLG